MRLPVSLVRRLMRAAQRGLDAAEAMAIARERNSSWRRDAQVIKAALEAMRVEIKAQQRPVGRYAPECQCPNRYDGLGHYKDCPAKPKAKLQSRNQPDNVPDDHFFTQRKSQ